MAFEARGARIPYVEVHLSGAAAGCGGLAYDDPKRWREFWGRPHLQVVAALLTRLERGPADVWVRTDDPPSIGVDVMADLGDVIGPVASIRGSLGADEFTALLAELAARNWRPAKVTTPAKRLSA